MNTKHTPGPWHLLSDNFGWTLTANGRDITMEAFDCTDSDAALIAAAPDLLLALEAIVKITDGSQPIDYPGALMVARSAIAKAKIDHDG